MRALKRNKQQMYYAQYVDKQPVMDEYGNETGEYDVIYSEPAPLRLNISPAKGESSTKQFGDSDDYDRVILSDDVTCSINEDSILWIDNLDTGKSYDYIVKKVARSLNSVSYAVSKVNVRE